MARRTTSLFKLDKDQIGNIHFYLTSQDLNNELYNRQEEIYTLQVYVRHAFCTLVYATMTRKKKKKNQAVCIKIQAAKTHHLYTILQFPVHSTDISDPHFCISKQM